MINILFPIAGANQYFPEIEYPFPKPLIEINGKTIIESVINNYCSIKSEKRFIFIVNRKDCDKYHLDNVLTILVKNQCEIIKIDNETKGAACSALMAIKHVNNLEPLIIANADQLINLNLSKIIKQFTDAGADAGVVTFDSVHPRWSYIRLDDGGMIVETAEKRPISMNAIAGFYYFSEGVTFVESTMRMIKKDATVDGFFYIAPVLNEVILEGKKIIHYVIDNKNYHTFYSPQKIKEFEKTHLS